jgi:hypothetical protein
MGWLSLASGLIKLVGVLMEFMRDRQLLDAGAKAQLAGELIALNDRLQLGIKIQQEERTVEEDLAILAGTNTAGGVRGESPPGAG